jgi:AcrR family transcriptional regulator
MTSADLRRVFERAEPGARKAHKRQLMACALDCFERAGLEATTIEDIRAAADSSIGSIYHHFGNKDGLVAALFFAALDDQAALVEPQLEAARDARGAVEASVRSYLEWVTAQPRLARFVYRARAAVAAGPHAQALAERNKRRHQQLRRWLVRGVEEGAIRELPKETYVPLLIGQSEVYCRAWLSERVKGKPSDHAAVFAEAAWRSLATGG